MVHHYAGKCRNSLVTCNFIQFQFLLALAEINFSQPCKILICIRRDNPRWQPFVVGYVVCGVGEVGF